MFCSYVKIIMRTNSLTIECWNLTLGFKQAKYKTIISTVLYLDHCKKMLRIVVFESDIDTICNEGIQYWVAAFQSSIVLKGNSSMYWGFAEKLY